ncbi:hypothetical protein CAPN008_01440 [Capnocytophaga canis]|uniref:tape measure protein n=1 Tax=Capnocytophaga canis TaxID=1848903 RepID=UPI001AC7B915|nr:tape measure protein [Capnocytophaga canis]GIM60094.1 hypothetical protein CAPN008_01440 [Capnocytophaga canis]
MNNNNGSIDFEARLRLEQLDKDLQALRDKFRETSQKAIEETNKIQESLNKVGTGLVAFLTINQAQQFIGHIASVRSEFQRLEISFSTMLKSKDKANKLMGEMVDLAAKTPFGLQDVSEGAKKLLAFQVPANEVTETLRRMGDVASGLGVPMGQLIHVYGQVKAQGKLMTNDLYQFMNAGIPIIAELSKVTGKAEQEVKSMVSAGKIGFGEIQQVFRNMTDESGLFHNLMAEQSKTLAGQYSNLQDSISNMFNEIGKSSEGAFSTAMEGATYLVENYKEVGKIIAELIAIYGTYKAVLITINAVRKLNTMILRQAVIEKRLAASANITLSNSEAIAVAKTKLLAVAKMQLTNVTRALNATMLANPYVLVAAAVAGLAYGIYKLVTRQTEAEKAQKTLNKAVAEFEKQTISETQTLNTLVAQLKATEKGTEDYNKIKKEITSRYGEYLEGLSAEKQSLEDIEGAYDAIIKKMQEKHRFQGFLQGIEDVNKELGEKVGNAQKEIKEKLIKGLGDKKGQEIYFKLLPIFNKEEVDYDEIKKVLELDEDGKTIAGGIGDRLGKKGFFGTYLKDIYDEITDINVAKKAAKEAISDAKAEMEALDQVDKETTETTSKKIPVYRSIADIQKEIKKTTSEINELRGKENFEVGVDDVKLKDKISLLENLNKELQERTGKEQKKKSTSKNAFDREAFDIEQQRKAFDTKLAQQKQFIEAMAEGYEKERALIDFHHKEKAESIDRAFEDELRKLEKMRKKGDISSRQYDSAKRIAFERYEQGHSANNDIRQQQEKKLLDNLLKEYQSYDEKRRKIEQRFSEEKKILTEQISKLQSNNEKGKNNELIAKIKEAVKLVDEQRSKEISELELSQKNVKTVLTEMYTDLSQKTSAELDQINERVQKFLQMLNGEYNIEIGVELGISKETFDTLKKDPKQMEALTKKGKEINQATIESKGLFKSLGANIKEAFNAKNPEAFQQAIGKVGGKVQSVMQMTGMFANAISEIGEATGDTSLKEFAEDLQNLMDVTNATMQGVQAGAAFGPAGAIIGGTLGFITSSLQKANEANRKHREAMKKLRESEINQQRIYNQLLWEEKLAQEDKKTVFGESQISKAIGYLASYTEAYEQFNNRIKTSQKTTLISFHEYYQKLRDEGISHEEAKQKAENTFKKGERFFNRKALTFNESDLSKVQVKTGSYTTGAWFWKKHHDQYGGILSKYPQLIDSSGEFNKKMAESILKTAEFGEGSKEALESIIEQYDNVKKSQEEFDSYLTSTFGQLGSGFVDAVVNSLKTGEDAFQAFAKTAGDVIGNLGKQMIEELFVTERFKKLKEDIKKAYSDGGGTTNVTDKINGLIGDFVQQQKGDLERAKDVWRTFLEQSERNGLDMTNFQQTTNRQAETKGLASMTQDQASELNAKFTLGLELDRVRNIHLEKMLVSSQEISSGFKMLQENSAKQLKHLAGIEVNTFVLHKMSEDMAGVKSVLSDIQLKGLKMR